MLAMQVDVTLSGHDHKYERTCPVFKKMCLPYDGNGTAGGPIHVVIGVAGYSVPPHAHLLCIRLHGCEHCRKWADWDTLSWQAMLGTS